MEKEHMKLSNLSVQAIRTYEATLGDDASLESKEYLKNHFLDHAVNPDKGVVPELDFIKIHASMLRLQSEFQLIYKNLGELDYKEKRDTIYSSLEQHLKQLRKSYYYVNHLLCALDKQRTRDDG